jgi:hypothetical protein
MEMEGGKNPASQRLDEMKEYIFMQMDWLVYLRPLTISVNCLPIPNNRTHGRGVPAALSDSNEASVSFRIFHVCEAKNHHGLVFLGVSSKSHLAISALVDLNFLVFFFFCCWGK